MIAKIEKHDIIDIFRTVIMPVISGVCLIVWFFFLFQYPVSVFPFILIVFLIIYFISGYVYGGVFLSFAVSAGLFSMVIVNSSYMRILLFCEIFWIVLLFFRIEYYRKSYVAFKNQIDVEYELLDRDVALIQSSILDDDRRSINLTKRMKTFQTLGNIIQSLEASLNEEELIELTNDIANKFIGKGKWKTKKITSQDVFAKYVKVHQVPLLIGDTSNDKRFSPDDYKNAVSIIVMPIEIDGNYWGAIKGISTQKEINFDDSDLRLLSILSNILGVILNNALLFNKIEALAITDGLTGLYTQSYFRERLQEEIERSKSNNLPLVVAMMDIDFFKKVNDTYGHQAGDIVLKQIADILRRRFREIDILARYGGEEFVVLMSHTDINEAFLILEEIRKTIETEKFFIPMESYHPIQVRKTISAGLSELAKNSKIEDLIKEADIALYNAKKTGRNKICLYNREKNEKN